MANNSPADEIFAQYGAPTTDSAPASPAMTPADEIFAQYAPQKSMNQQGSPWDWKGVVSNGVTVGGFPSIIAGGRAVKNVARDIAGGTDVGTAVSHIGDYYDMEKRYWSDARNQYNTDHPVAGPLGEAASSIPTSLYATALGGSGLATLGGRIAEAVPALGEVGNTLAKYGSAADAFMQNNMLTRYASAGVKLIPQGMGATVATQGLNDAPLSDQMKWSIPASMIFGAGGEAVGDVFHTAAQKIAGSGIGEYAANLAHKAINDYGIPLRADMMSSSPFMKYMGSGLENMPFTGYAGKAMDAKAAFTRAVTRSFGQDTDTITPDIVKNAFQAIGKKFDQVAANTPSIPLGEEFHQKLSAILDDAKGVLPSNEVTPIEQQISNMFEMAKNGVIDGKTYQALVQRGGSLSSAMKSSNSQIAQYASRIRSTLDDALESVANPADLNLLQEARYQYKNLKSVQPLLDKAQGGQIEPTTLMQRIRSGYGKDYSTGDAGTLGDLAQIGQRFFKSPPNSGTAYRQVVNKLLGAAGEIGIAGATMGSGVFGAAGAAALGLGAGRVIGSAMDNPLTRGAILRAGVNNGAAPGFVSNVLLPFLGHAADAGNTLTPYVPPAAVAATNRLRGSGVSKPPN